MRFKPHAYHAVLDNFDLIVHTNDWSSAFITCTFLLLLMHILATLLHKCIKIGLPSCAFGIQTWFSTKKFTEEMKTKSTRCLFAAKNTEIYLWFIDSSIHNSSLVFVYALFAILFMHSNVSLFPLLRQNWEFSKYYITKTKHKNSTFFKYSISVWFIECKACVCTSHKAREFSDIIQNKFDYANMDALSEIFLHTLLAFIRVYGHSNHSCGEHKKIYRHIS